MRSDATRGAALRPPWPSDVQEHFEDRFRVESDAESVPVARESLLRVGRGQIPGRICHGHLFLASLVVAAACDRPADTALPGGVPFLEQDSAGVLVATTLGTRARTPIGWLVDTVPEYQVGGVEGEEPYLFTGIRGAQQLSDGRVVVLDEASCELRFFGADGVFLERAGGRGEGPGEFRSTVVGCELVPSPGNDSLHAFDGAALSYFDDRGRFSHRFPVRWRDERVMDVVGVVGESALVTTRFYAMAEGEGLSREPSTADFALLDLESRQAVWEGFFQGQRNYMVVMPTLPIPRVIWQLPFDILPDAAMGEDGFHLTLGENQGPEILEYGASGRLRRIIRLAEPPLTPSTNDLEKLVEFGLDPYEMADTTRERIFEVRMRLYRDMPLPEIMPVFSRLLVDAAGWLWAELYRYDVRAPVRWLVFGANGEGLGSVDMPPDLEVLQIGRDFVLGVWRDELEVTYVRRHAIRGRG